MNTIRIKQIFQSKFDYQTYCNEIVHSIFGCNDVAIRPELLDTTAEGDECNYIGRMTDNSGRELGFFYTRVASGSDVRRKRVGLRKMIAPYLKYDVDAAIAVFADKNRWRLSYICDMKEGVTNAKRFSYILGDEQGQYKTPLERLDNIYAKRGKFVLNDLREAFSVDALSDEFFDEYHIHYDRIVAELARQGKSGAVYHDYVKKLMGRIVFLHFLQKKGWLCGDTNFMLNTFNQSNRKNDYLESVLEPLFFGILNTEPAKREQVFSRNGWQQRWVGQWSNIPYLNGGLFERDAVDDLRIVLPEYIFSDLFCFLASYNFTVDENDPDDAEIGVDPEMLGKIFESLLEDNKAKGAFYTPKEIVRYMCKESLIAYLSSKLPDTQESVVRTFVEHHEMQPELELYRDILYQALRDVKICDPAIGSGAFPMGLLNELWRCREALEPTESRVALKKEIIENNIYGVDIERGAIDIARLRFWLSIVVDSEKAEPLPNFDYKFMQGNSLIESYQGCDLSRISGRTVGRPSTSTQLVIGLDSDLSRKNLQRLLREYFSVTDHQKKANMRQAINDEVKTLIRESLGGTAASLAKLNALDPSANQDFFLWHTWFKDIFDNGGFDIVIGNPPYISAVEMARTESEKDLYKRMYPQAVGAYDIYILFLLRGLMLSKNIFYWIIPNKFLISDYSKITLSHLQKNGLFKSVDVSTFSVFKNASVYPIIIEGSKLHPKDFTKYRLNYYSDLLQGNFNQIREVVAVSTILDYKIHVCSGATGFEAQKIKEFVTDEESSNSIPFTVSGNIDRYCYNNKNVRYMKSKYDNAFIKINREISGGKIKLWESPKIIIAGMTKVIEATYVEEPLAIGVGVYAIDDFAGNDPYYILGLLNSKYTSYYLREKFKDKHLAGGYLAINKSTIEQLPFIKASIDETAKIINITRQILTKKQANHTANTLDLEREIDRSVYQLYNLTEEEIAVIEQ